MLRRRARVFGYDYVQPMNGKPIKQARDYGDPSYINNEPAMIRGQWALITADFGVVHPSFLENARLAILRRIPRVHFNLVMHTDYEEFPMPRRANEARMGGGMPNIHHYSYKFTTCIPLFELQPTKAGKYEHFIDQSDAELIFMPAKRIIPLATVVVPRGRVDEYTVFR